MNSLTKSMALDYAQHGIRVNAICPAGVWTPMLRQWCKEQPNPVRNRVVFKNYLQAKCAGFIQVDAVRVAGVSEFIAVSLLCRKFGVPVVPHVGDMGQLHQHLVLFNHVALGHEIVFLEYVPHLREHFVHPVRVDGGVYRTPQEPGASCDLKSM